MDADRQPARPARRRSVRPPGSRSAPPPSRLPPTGPRADPQPLTIAGTSSIPDDPPAATSDSRSKSVRARWIARAPQRNSSRTCCLTRSTFRMSSAPISPVARTWVPPQALRSRSAMVTIRSVPVRSDAFRSPVAVAASSNATVTGRFSVTTSLARSSAWRTWSGRSGRRSPGRGSMRRRRSARLRSGRRTDQREPPQQMLAGVLLHVVEPPCPIDRARHLGRRAAARPADARSVVLVDHIDHGRCPPACPRSCGWPPEVG